MLGDSARGSRELGQALGTEGDGNWNGTKEQLLRWRGYTPKCKSGRAKRHQEGTVIGTLDP